MAQPQRLARAHAHACGRAGARARATHQRIFGIGARADRAGTGIQQVHRRRWCYPGSISDEGWDLLALGEQHAHGIDGHVRLVVELGDARVRPISTAIHEATELSSRDAVVGVLLHERLERVRGAERVVRVALSHAGRLGRRVHAALEQMLG